MPHRSSLEAALAKLGEQEALAAETERIARIGTFVHDLETGVSVRSVEMKRLWGITEDDASFQAIIDRVHPDEREAMRSAYERLRVEGGHIDREFPLLMDDGELRYVHVRGEVVQIAGRVGLTIIGTTQDISRRRQVEELIAAQTARLKDMQSELIYLARQSAMGTMASTLAHELNQPLTAITSYASGLRRLIASPGATEVIAEGLNALEENALRAGEIIRRMREMARQGEGRKERLDLESLITEAVRFATIGRKVAVSLDLKHRKSAVGDRIQIQQVLINLLKNACEAGEASGECRIEIATADVEAGIRLCVSDTGPGIDTKLLPSLFEAKVSTKADGMGIGLSICRTIIEAHGGHISGKNLATGARFCFTLPAEPQR